MRKTRIKVWQRWWKLRLRVDQQTIEREARERKAAASSKEAGQPTQALADPRTREAFFVKGRLNGLDKAIRAAHEACHMVDPSMRHDKVVEIAAITGKLYERL